MFRYSVPSAFAHDPAITISRVQLVGFDSDWIRRDQPNLFGIHGTSFRSLRVCLFVQTRVPRGELLNGHQRSSYYFQVTPRYYE